MPGYFLTLRSAAAMLVGKGAAAIAVGALIGTGGVVLVSTHLPSPPPGTHGAAVVQAVQGTCRALNPGDRQGSSATPAATPSPGAFGRCVSSVARQNPGHSPKAGSGIGEAGGASVAGRGRGASGGPPPWAKAKGRHRGTAPNPGPQR